MTELVLVHGRSQQGKVATDLKAEWVGALRNGLRSAGLELPIPESAIRFPYYGDTLDDLVKERSTVADVIVRGDGDGIGEEERAFLESVLRETVAAAGIDRTQVEAAFEQAEVEERGPQNGRWVHAALRALDLHVPGASASSIALATRDVYRYLRSVGIRDRIESGVREALRPDVPAVVVGHSLGTVVTYNLLRRDGDREGWQVPLYVTLGSPLAVTAIRTMLVAREHPRCAGAWFNAMDPRDIVALHPLDATYFPVEPPIENKVDVVNDTPNRHGITGYLSDPEVARRIHDALVARPGTAAPPA
jgi:hypothetical protein